MTLLAAVALLDFLAAHRDTRTLRVF